MHCCVVKVELVAERELRLAERELRQAERRGRIRAERKLANADCSAQKTAGKEPGDCSNPPGAGPSQQCSMSAISFAESLFSQRCAIFWGTEAQPSAEVAPSLGCDA